MNEICFDKLKNRIGMILGSNEKIMVRGSLKALVPFVRLVKDTEITARDDLLIWDTRHIRGHKHNFGMTSA